MYENRGRVGVRVRVNVRFVPTDVIRGRGGVTLGEVRRAIGIRNTCHPGVIVDSIHCDFTEHPFLGQNVKRPRGHDTQGSFTSLVWGGGW